MSTLFQEVRSEQNIFSAWRHVKRSALLSLNDEIRGAASEFEYSHQRHLRRIINQLREDRFIFDPVEGVLKDRKKRRAAGKDPRPIAIATLKNRVVQRAILQVLQPRIPLDLREKETRYKVNVDDRLGRINDVNQSRFGVGGLIYPYGGVAPAINLIRSAIDSGAKYYYQSDIKAFFTQIPTSFVINFVREQTKDESLANLFSKGLDVQLSNKDELLDYANLFPQGGIGVAQGSSLSAFAGNVLLYDFDHELNAMGVTAVRYIDDILIVAEDEVILEKAIRYAVEKLSVFGFGLYTPAGNTDKAARGRCSDSFNFLGCTIRPNRCVPSKASISRLEASIVDSISSSKSAIKKCLETNEPINPKKNFAITLDMIGKKIYGWQKSFSFCTSEQPFKQIDSFIIKQIVAYETTVRRMLNNCDPKIRMMVLGIPSMEEMFLTKKYKTTERKNYKE